MTDKYGLYDNAASRVESAWVQGMPKDHSTGGVCLTQSIAEATGSFYTNRLPYPVLKEIARELHWSAGYWIGWLLHIHPWPTLQERIELWNDMPGRRQQAVVKLLRRLAAAHAEDTLTRLRAEAASLTAQRDLLQARIERLEAENKRLWRRLLGQRELELDKKALEELDAELDNVMAWL